MCNFDTDIGTEELAHLEIVSTIIHQLTKGLAAKNFYAFSPGFDAPVACPPNAK